MSNRNSAESPEDYDYWYNLQIGDRPLTGALFDEDGFARDFGSDAAEAFREYAHFKNNLGAASNHPDKFESAKERLAALGIDPEEVLGGKSNSKIRKI